MDLPIGTKPFSSIVMLATNPSGPLGMFTQWVISQIGQVIDSGS